MLRSILLIACSAWLAAEVEAFTLKDGRHLVGTYDEAAARLTLNGPGKAAIPLDTRDIVSRSPATEEELARPAAKPVPAAPPVEEKHKAAPAEALAALRLHETWQAAHDTEALAEQAQQRAWSEYARARDVCLVQFMAAADLSPFPIKVPENASAQDLIKAQRIQRLNQRMAKILESRTLKHPGGERERESLEDQLPLYAELRGLPWLVELSR